LEGEKNSETRKIWLGDIETETSGLRASRIGGSSSVTCCVMWMRVKAENGCRTREKKHRSQAGMSTHS
jgi:hypothetical protein